MNAVSATEMYTLKWLKRQSLCYVYFITYFVYCLSPLSRIEAPWGQVTLPILFTAEIAPKPRTVPDTQQVLSKYMLMN